MGRYQTNLPPMPDPNLQRFFDQKHIDAREDGRKRARKWWRKHRGAEYKLGKVPAIDAPPDGRQGHWVIRALLDKDNVVMFVATCRTDDTIHGIVSGLAGYREINLFSNTFAGRMAESLVKSLVSAMKPVGNAAPKPSLSGKGKFVPNSKSRYIAFYAFW